MILQEHENALNLLNAANKSTPLTSSSGPYINEVQGKEASLSKNLTDIDSHNQNKDIKRAKEMVDLHYEMKSNHRDGAVDDDLARLRDHVVNRVLLELN